MWKLRIGTRPTESFVTSSDAPCSKRIRLPVAVRGEVPGPCDQSQASPHVIFYHANDGVADVGYVLDGRRDLDEIFAHEPR